jgi:hypothetical protein
MAGSSSIFARGDLPALRFFNQIVMAPKFGSYLFRNLKGQTPEASSEIGSAGAFGAFEEQPILLRKEDIRADDPSGPSLDWSKVENGQITVRIKETQGISDGCVTIKASTLQQICPALLASSFEPDFAFPVSLKTVVLQIQAHLQRKLAEPPRAEGPDFDTPIAQVAREDEGFFKLEKVAQHPAEPDDKPQNPADSFLGTSDSASFPLIREKPRSEKPGVEAPPLEIGLQPPVGEKGQAQAANAGALFDDLPKVGRGPSPGKKLVAPSPVPREKAEAAETGEAREPERPATIGLSERKPPRRAGLERLQEIFMTEDLLDAREVAALMMRFPKVRGVLVLSGEGTLMGGTLPKEFDLATAGSAPAILRTVQEFGKRLQAEHPFACTIFSKQPVSICSAGNIYILVVHEGRGFLPGMRERICEIGAALSMLYGSESGSNS